MTSLLSELVVEFLGDGALADLLSQLMLNFLHEMLTIEQSEAEVVPVESSEVLELNVVRLSLSLVLNLGHHLFMMTPALNFVPGINVSTHLHIEALRFVLDGGELIRLANQKEVVVELLLVTPVSYLLLL